MIIFIYLLLSVKNKIKIGFGTPILILLNLNLFSNNPYFIFTMDSNFNKELYNGLLLIHPILTYITCIMFITLLLRVRFKQKIVKTNTIKIKFILCFLVNLVALFLGSIWAQQELNWGGWWNWDSIEIILLSFLLLNLFFLHLSSKYNIFVFMEINYFYRLIYIVLFYFVVRSNFINSIHAFSTSAQLQKYFYFAMVLLPLFIFYYNIFFKYKKVAELFNLKVLTNFIKPVKKNFFLFIFLNSLVILITYVNVYLYINSFKFNINFYRYISVFIKMLVNYYFIFIKTPIKINIFLSFFIFYFLFFENDFLFIFEIVFLILLRKQFLFKQIHLIVVFLFFILLCYYNIFLKNYCGAIYTLKLAPINWLIYSNELLNVFQLNLVQKLDTLYFSTFEIKNLSNFLDFFNELSSGIGNNFFNCNLSVSHNYTLINYVVDGFCSNSVDFFLPILFLLFSFLFIIFFWNFFFLKFENFKKNGIV